MGLLSQVHGGLALPAALAAGGAVMGTIAHGKHLLLPVGA